MKSQIGDNKSWNIRKNLAGFRKQMFRKCRFLSEDELSTIQDRKNSNLIARNLSRSNENI
jgi:hypothetical protein